MTKKTASILVSVLILGGIAYLAYSAFNPKLKGKQKETIATLVETHSISRGRAAYYKFVCSGIPTMSHGGSASYNSVIGEKYMAYYDSLDCDNLSIDWTRPLFLEDELTEMSMGEIVLSISSGILQPMVKFEYQVDGINYRQVQYMEDDFDKINPQIKEGATFQVEYWLQNPQRSIMRFEGNLSPY